MARRLDYQEALRRPGTSPRMVASRSLLRPRPNLAYTARGRPVRAQRLFWRDGEESRGSFCSLTTASIFSSYPVAGSLMIFFSASRLSAYFFASFSRLVSRLTIDVFAMVLSSDQRNGKRNASSSARASSFVFAVRSEESRVGKECVRTCRSRCSPYHSTQI